MVTAQYQHIWDCCCDHGLLGLSLLQSHKNSNVHFVDIVPPLMNTLEQKLTRFYADYSWQTHCLDVAKLPLRQFQGKQLIIIAGVGGDLMINFIEHIYQHHSDLDIDFLLCPVHHQFALREKLIALNFSLYNEALIKENKRFYEVLHLSSMANTSTKISPVGDKIWQATTAEQIKVVKQYKQKNLNHYLRIQQGTQYNKANSVQHIIDAYLSVKLDIQN